MIFQEARKIVTAVYQIVIYKEFLPALLGSSTAENPLYRHAGLKLLDAAHYMGYDAALDPHVLNEFAAAGFRYYSVVCTVWLSHTGQLYPGKQTKKESVARRLHTLVDDNVPRLLFVTGLAENVLLSTQYNNQTLLYEGSYGLASFLGNTIVVLCLI